MVDIKDVPRDPVLEHLPRAVDPDIMRHALAPHFGTTVDIRQVKIDRFQYKPGRSARITYVVKLRHTASGTRARQILCARMEPPRTIQELHDKMRRHRWATPAYGPALLHLPELSMVLWGFPNDPKLDGVEHIGDPTRFLEQLRSLPAARRLNPVACEGSVVKYVPGKRLVMKHIVRDAAGNETTLYSKTFGHDRGEAIHDVMRHLHARSQEEPGALTTPPPLGWIASLRTLVQGELAGWSAVETLQDADWSRFMRIVGRGLAHVHGSGVEGLEAWSSDDERDNLVQATQLLLDHDPGLAACIDEIRQRAGALQEQLQPSEARPIHTAFRFTQLLADGDRLALVDFDGFRQGDPACDVGSFLAHLHYLAVKKEISLEQSREAAEVFLSAYRDTATSAVDEDNIAWYTAVILVAKHGQKMVKRLKEDGADKLQCLLDDALRLLRQGAPS